MDALARLCDALAKLCCCTSGMPEESVIQEKDSVLQLLDVNDDIDAEGLGRRAFTTFQILEAWRSMSVDASHEAIMNIRSLIIAQETQYVNVIVLSEEMATKGVTLAETAIRCIAIVLGNGSQAELDSAITLMKDVANKGLLAAREVEQSFKEIRSHLIQIWRDSQHIDADPKTLVLARRPSPDPRKIWNQLVQTSLIDTVNQIDVACKDLKTMIRDIGLFADWWGQRVTALSTIKTLSPMATTNQAAAKMVLEKWENTKSRFMQYKQQISFLQDCYVRPEVRQLDAAHAGRDDRIDEDSPATPATPVKNRNRTRVYGGGNDKKVGESPAAPIVPSKPSQSRSGRANIIRKLSGGDANKSGDPVEPSESDRNKSGPTYRAGPSAGEDDRKSGESPTELSKAVALGQELNRDTNRGRGVVVDEGRSNLKESSAESTSLLDTTMQEQWRAGVY